MINVEVSASIFPTEDLEKVSLAISRMFEGIEFEISDFSGSSETGIEKGQVSWLFAKGGLGVLRTLHRLFREEGIIDSVRDKVFEKGLSEDGLSLNFLLNKQVAFAGFANIPPEEEPLGSLKVKIRADSPSEMKRLFEWLVPLTENGKPLIEVDMAYVENF
ncbi:MAG: RNA-binding domain-containing protein [Methanosarcinaceae archaeon]|nr:RNA-binding domain-containing protein [Methanosarcinaceae archaeon]MDD4748341.1 RNA-binding domain-containing protein [Methanosarcinaceae archaeon]